MIDAKSMKKKLLFGRISLDVSDPVLSAWNLS